MTNLKQQLLRYWLAMSASAFDAATHSCAAFLGVAGAHAAVESVPVLNLQQLAAVFLISFARGLLNYLDAHPVSALVGGGSSPETQPERGLSQSAARGQFDALKNSEEFSSSSTLRVETTRAPAEAPGAPATRKS